MIVTRAAYRVTVLTCAVALFSGSACSIADEPEESGPASLKDLEESGPASLKDLQLSEGPPSPGFMMSVIDGRLPEGDVVLSPAFDSAATDYTADVTQETVTLRLSAAPGATIEVTGAAADGTTLPVVNRTFLGNLSNAGRSLGSFESMTLSGLTAGANTMEVAVTAADETAKQGYTLVVTRTAAR